jgi:hypothetical protein
MEKLGDISQLFNVIDFHHITLSKEKSKSIATKIFILSIAKARDGRGITREEYLCKVDRLSHSEGTDKTVISDYDAKEKRKSLGIKESVRGCDTVRKNLIEKQYLSKKEQSRPNRYDITTKGTKLLEEYVNALMTRYNNLEDSYSSNLSKLRLTIKALNNLDKWEKYISDMPDEDKEMLLENSSLINLFPYKLVREANRQNDVLNRLIQESNDFSKMNFLRSAIENLTGEKEIRIDEEEIKEIKEIREIDEKLENVVINKPENSPSLEMSPDQMLGAIIGMTDQEKKEFLKEVFMEIYEEFSEENFQKFKEDLGFSE